MSFINSLLMMIAGATQAELSRQVQYLKVENETLRSKLPPRIVVTLKERKRLLKFGAKLGKGKRPLNCFGGRSIICTGRRVIIHQECIAN